MSSRLPLSSRPSFLPDEVAKREFATVFRGYDAAEVRTFLNQMAEQAADNSDRIAELQRALVETEERVKNPELDEEMVTKLLGEQTAQILRSARLAADDMRQKAEDEVGRQLREAHEVTGRMRQEAEQLLADRTDEAERSANAIKQEAQQAADEMRTNAENAATQLRNQVGDETDRKRAETEAEMLRLRQQTQSDLVDERSKARAQARDIIDTARTEAEALVDRTNARQTELLEGLVRKRKIALAQVEELRAGRERLLGAYRMVRGTLDDVTVELERVEDEARQAAGQAGRQTAAQGGLGPADLDEIIETEHYTLNDDVPVSIVDLAESEDDPIPVAAPSNSAEDADVSDAEVIDVTELESQSFGGDESPSMMSQPDLPMAGGEGGRMPGGPVALLDRSDAEAAIDDDQAALGEEDDEDALELRATSSTLVIGADTDVDRGLQLRREAVASKARGQAVRRLRRSLQEEQDSVVARLRGDEFKSVQALLGSVDDQVATHQRAIVKLFREVVRTGASSVEGSTGVERGIIDRTGTTAARGLAEELVDDLRGQLQPVLEELVTADELPDLNTLQSLVGGPYNVVRGDHLDQLVEDRVGGVFDQGTTLAESG